MIAWLRQRSKSIHIIAIAADSLVHHVVFHIKQNDQGKKLTTTNKQTNKQT